MANPPPARPWFRLPMLGRQAPPPPPAPAAQAQPRAPAPQQPRPPFVRPAFAQAFRPPQPQPQPAPPQPPLPSFRTTTRQPPVVAPSPTPRPVIAPNSIVSPSPSPPASPSPPPPASPPNVASSRTPAMTSPKAFVISLPSTTTSSEFTPKQSPIGSPLLSSASPRKPQVSEELPPRVSSIDSPASTFPPKSSSYPSINSFHSPTPTASPRAIETLIKSSPVSQSPGKFIRSLPPTSPPPQSELPGKFIRSPPPTSSPPQSESHGKFIRFPSPVSLPPQPSFKEEPEPRALAEAEQKKVVFQEAFNAPGSKSTSAKVFGNTYNTSSKYGGVKEEDHRKLPFDSEEAARNMRILTIAGESKGASMELGFSARSNSYFNGNNNVGNEARESEDLHNSKADWSGHEGMTTRRWPMNAYVNSNVQPINSSILLSCSLTQHDPGVHFSLSKKPIKGNDNGNGHGVGLKDHANTNQE